MGNVLSSRGAASAAASRAETRSMLSAESSTKASGTAPPLYLDEMEPTPAAWSQESKCVLIQRFFGWLPDSPAEKLKQDQRAPLYAPRVVIHDVVRSTSRGQAIVVVQRVYRRFRVLRKWHLVSHQVLEIARSQLRERAEGEEEEEMLANFRQILAGGFSAQKVSITGALKNIQLQLVLKPEQEECYLTWTPSRKRQPRIHLYDIQEVVPVLNEGNKHAPRLANKVSHRRGLIIVCNSHHRGRVVLQMGTKRERKVLLLGFQRLLKDLNRFAPTMDATGSIRKRLPRRQSAIKFFGHASSDDRDDPSEESPAGEADHVSPASPSKLSKRHSTSIERFYHTRFDDSFRNGDETQTNPVEVARKPSLARRSSTVM